MLPAYAELHCLTNFSFLRGASHPEELVERAQALGYAALAVTDECSFSGVVRAHVAAKNAGFPLVIGTEVTLVDGVKLVLLATDRGSYGNLSQLITRGRRNAEKGRYALARDDVAMFADGLSRCGYRPMRQRGPTRRSTPPPPTTPRSAPRAGSPPSFPAGRGSPSSFSPAPAIARSSRIARRSRARPACRRSPPATSTCTFAPGARCRTRSRRSGSGSRSPNAATRSIRTANGICVRARGSRRSIRPSCSPRPSRSRERCAFSLDELRYEYPEEIVPPGHTPASHLRSSPTKDWRGGTGAARCPPEVRELIEHELALIAELRYEPYFLTVHDIVAFARSRDILCQGRGSAANSAVCYALGITEVDPSRMSMLFERFISKERNEPPDIDVDFEHQRREEVMQYIYAKIRPRPRGARRDAHHLPAEERGARCRPSAGPRSRAGRPALAACSPGGTAARSSRNASAKPGSSPTTRCSSVSSR